MDKRFVSWSPTARADLRAIDRKIALGILQAIDDYLAKGIGDVIMLQGPRAEFRLRVGDYRVIFLPAGEHSMEVLHVKHRSQAYR